MNERERAELKYERSVLAHLSSPTSGSRLALLCHVRKTDMLKTLRDMQQRGLVSCRLMGKSSRYEATQMGLELAGLATVPKLNRTVEARDKKRLCKACFRILEAFLTIPEVLPAEFAGSELEKIAGRRFGARLNELRYFLKRESGRGEYVPARDYSDFDANAFPRPWRRVANDPLYEMAKWARPAAAAALMNWKNAQREEEW